MARRRFLLAECGQKHNAADGKPVGHDCYTFNVSRLADYARNERLRQQPFCTSFCNHSHDLKDGKPIDHECYVLRVDVLERESEGDFNGAPAPVEPRKTHKGKKRR